MPQLDVFIFINSGIYLFLGFFGLLAYIHIYILPSFSSLIKLRKKLLVRKLVSNEDNLAKLQSLPLEKFLNY